MIETFKIDKLYNLVMTVFGRRGSGKTFRSCRIAEQFDKCIIYDTRDRIGAKKTKVGIYDAYMEGAKVIYNDFDALIDLIAKKEKKFCYIFKPMLPREDFEYFCQICDSAEVTDTLIFIEEIGLLTDSYAAGIEPNFYKLLRFGRHNGIHLLMNSQRPQDVHRSITAESSHIIVFNQTEQRDIAYFAGYIKDTAVLPKLKDYEFMVWNNGDTKIYDKSGQNISKAV